jgi:diadenosine hexaphosphate hydrolase (ATP-forming)
VEQIQQAGGIVVNPKGQIAIITSLTNRKTFPKGSQESGEKPIDTARREIYEETGLQNILMHQELGVITRLGFTAENLVTPSVMKHIHMFYCTTQELKLQPQEPDVKQAEWVNPDLLEALLSWPEEAKFFLEHRAKLIL